MHQPALTYVCRLNNYRFAIQHLLPTHTQQHTLLLPQSTTTKDLLRTLRTMKFIASVILALAATANTASAFTPARKSLLLLDFGGNDDTAEKKILLCRVPPLDDGKLTLSFRSSTSQPTYIIRFRCSHRIPIGYGIRSQEIY